MRSAEYAVVRFVADPARNEPVNLGIVLWTERASRLKLDDDAIARVVRDNPHLSRDSLHYLDNFLRRRLAMGDVGGTSEIARHIQNRSQFPVLITEPRFTTLSDDSEAAIDDELNALLARVVRPQSRRAGWRPGTARQLAQRWKPWLGAKVVQNYVFEQSKTGVPRMVSFFANSGADIAVDVLSLAIKDADDIQRRADAEAYKVVDVLAKHHVSFVVHCDMRGDDQYEDANAAALRTLSTSGARVTTTVEDTVAAVESAIGVG